MHDDPPSLSPETASAHAASIATEVGKALSGKSEAIAMAVTALVARGHLLVEDVPGVGKTTLARALAKVLGVPFARLSCTSDLLPADVLGGSVYVPTPGGGATMTFRPGPVFTSVLLADELNRATPRTQSALLEAMEERRVSIEGETRPLPDPFFVVATQNPDELHGTYPLPDSQLDRFLLRISIGHPDRATERALLVSRRAEDPVGALRPVSNATELAQLQDAADRVRVDEAIVDYLHDVVLRTRKSAVLAQGASTRAVLATMRAVRALALVRGRTYATPDDAKDVVSPALAHRVRPIGDGGRLEAERALLEILDRVPVPT